MDSRDWLFEGAEVPLPAGEDIFTLPANMSGPSFWHDPTLSDITLNVDQLAPLPQVQDMITQRDAPKTENSVSDDTDAQLFSSPVTSRVDATATSPRRAPSPAQHVDSQRSFSSTKPARTISKASERKFMPAFFLERGRAFPSAQEHKVKSEKSLSAQKRPADEGSRQRHNQMMRENRGRFNGKFRELTELLETLRKADRESKPMKNKIQILEMAMYIYADLEAIRAKYKNELLFSPPTQPSISSHEASVIASAPSLLDACGLVVRNMCGSLDWKYGEVWINSNPESPNESSFVLGTAFISPSNMPSTRQSLQNFAHKGRSSSMGDLLLTLSRLRHAIWIPDVVSKSRESRRAAEAVAAGVTTMLTIPVHLGGLSSTSPHAFIVLMHVDDDLLSHQGAIRPYDSTSICRLTDLTSALIHTRSIPA